MRRAPRNGATSLMRSGTSADKSPMSAIPGMLGGAQGSAFGARMRVRVLASFYLAGATLVLVTLLLPHAADANETALLAITLDAYAVGALMWWRAERLSASLLPFVLAWGSVLIIGVAWCSAEHPSPLVFFYLWVFLVLRLLLLDARRDRGGRVRRRALSVHCCSSTRRRPAPPHGGPSGSRR